MFTVAMRGRVGRSRLRVAVEIIAVMAVYALAARGGLLLDPVGGFASVVWAPTGIAIAAVMLGGYHLAAGVFLGALAANLVTGAPALAAAAVGTGNMLEAVAAAGVLGRLRDFESRMGRLRDVVAFMLVAALAPVLSASVGTASLRAAGVLAAAQWPEAFRAWWVGDTIGALLVTPFIVAWWRAGAWLGRRRIELALNLLSVVIVSSIVFFRGSTEHTTFLQTYLLLPPLIWAAVRLEQRGATAAVLATSAIAIAGTAHGSGPFAAPELYDSLFRLQTFMGIVAISFLVLAAAIAERAWAQRELARALEQEAGAHRAKTDFLAVMSHELRTPLNAISGYAELIDMEVYGPLTEGQRDALARIRRNQAHVASLVDDLLSFIGVEQGRVKIELRDVPLDGALAALADFLELEARRKELRLDFAPVDDGLRVRADPEKLRHVLLNLLTNAIKYTPEGGHVRVTTARDGATARITVSDSGIGIPADQLARVFEPFFQAERGKTRRYPGVGLGLTIARDLARAMGGDVAIESVLGEGTTVTLTLPEAPAPPAASV